MATPSDDASQSERNGPGYEGNLRALHQRGEPINILVVGPARVGKSTLINAMFGEDVAKVEHRARSVISEVEEYQGEYKGVRIKVCVTVGFRHTGRKRDYNTLLDIDKHMQFNLILICSKLGGRADRDMFLELASVLNKEMWKKTVVVLTFANQFITLESVVDKSEMGRQRDEHKECVVGFLSKSINNEVLQGIPFCLAGVKDEKELAMTEDWVKTLWIMCMDRCSEDTSPLLSFYAKHRRLIVAAAAGGLVGVVTGGLTVPFVGAIIGTGAGGVVGAIAGIATKKVLEKGIMN